VAIGAFGFVNVASGAPHGGGGGGHGGGGGGHPGGGGGGGFHMGGGGHPGGGGGAGFHMGGGGHPGGGGFHMGGGGHPGGGGFHLGGAAHPGGVSHGFASHRMGGHAPAGHGFAAHGLAGHAGHAQGRHAPAFAEHAAGRHGASANDHNMGGARNGAAEHGQPNAADRINGHGQAAHEQNGHNAFGRDAGGNRTARGQEHNQFERNQAAHNQFVAQNFHGLHNFSPTGFNRNAFGDPNGWNSWGEQFYGPGWNSWGNGWGGWAGPVFWPFLVGDVFSFAFWPDDYYDPFWAYGPDFLLASIFAPGPYFGSDYGYAPSDYGTGAYNGYADYTGSSNIYYGGAPTNSARSSSYSGVTEADRQSLSKTNAAAEQSCNGLAPGVTDLPIDRIKDVVKPTDEQVAALDDLSTADAKAGKIVKASCPTAVPLTPVARLEAAESRLDAVIQAIDVIRDPLQKFYESLSDEQKQRFNTMGASANGGEPAGGNVATLCSQRSADATNLPVQRIQQVVQPNGQNQENDFAALRQASRDAADQLQASCPPQTPQTPVGRLNAVKKRLQAMVDAMNTIHPKLQAFYSSLSDEQRARFNTMGPQNASSAKERQGSNR
jgi:hypothetical protein